MSDWNKDKFSGVKAKTKLNVNVGDFGIDAKEHTAIYEMLKYAEYKSLPIESPRGYYFISKRPPQVVKDILNTPDEVAELKWRTDPMNMYKKQERYCNQSGSKDLIDRWADEKSPEEFRAIMIAQIEKYCSRYGKKDDVVNEIRKIVDYGQRLLDYEIKLGDKSE